MKTRTSLFSCLMLFVSLTAMAQEPATTSKAKELYQLGLDNYGYPKSNIQASLVENT
ncbi:MAG: hypothetical protein IJT89_01765 [Bacteroidaceae bacterium]|nr:hypothetical protein [Bacteroidaceae bacterium]